MLMSACAGARPTVSSELFLEELPEARQQAGSNDPATPVPASTVEPEPTPEPAPTPAPEPAQGEIERFRPEIIDTYPHQPDAFTQGLLIDDGVLIESTGMRFQSDLRRVEITTGDVLAVEPMPDEQLFAEGLTKVGSEFVQLTWTSGRALWWDENFQLLRESTYEGEGWGICFDGERLIMSDGSSALTFRDPVSFEPLGSVEVSLDGAAVNRLNELECVDGQVWANVWQTDLIVRIDPATGLVTATVDATVLSDSVPPGADVLNGIAWDEATDTFLVTGKYWPTMYRVRFVPLPAR